jgi:hypothetical protein
MPRGQAADERAIYPATDSELSQDARGEPARVSLAAAGKLYDPARDKFSFPVPMESLSLAHAVSNPCAWLQCAQARRR